MAEIVINEFRKKYKKLFQQLNVNDDEALHENIIACLRNGTFHKYEGELTDKQKHKIKEFYQKDENVFALFKKYQLSPITHEEFLSAIIKDGVESAWENFMEKIIKKHLIEFKKELDELFPAGKSEELITSSSDILDVGIKPNIMILLMQELGVSDDLHEKILDSLKNNRIAEFEYEITDEQFEKINKVYNENTNSAYNNTSGDLCANNFEYIKNDDKKEVKIKTENSIIANESTTEYKNNFVNIVNGDKTEVKILTEDSIIANESTTANKKNIGNKTDLIKKFINNHILQQKVNFLSTFEIFMNVNNMRYLDVKRAIEETNKDTNIVQILSLILKYFVGCLKVGNDYSALFNHAQFRNPKSHFYCFDETTLIIYVFELYELYAQELVLFLSKMSRPIPFSYLWYDNKNDNSNWIIHLKAFSEFFWLDNPFIVSLGQSNIGKSKLLNSVFTTSFVTKKNGIFSGGVDITLNTEEFSTGFNIVDVHCQFEMDLLKCLFSIFISERCWILLHIKDSNKIKEYLSVLFKIGIKKENIILILRDTPDGSDINLYENENKLENHIINICHTNDDDYDGSIIELKTFLFKIIGIGKNRRFPPSYANQFKNNYFNMENNAEKFNNIDIKCHSEEFREVSIKITEILKETEIEDFRNKQFPHLKCLSEIESLNKLKIANNNNSISRTNYDSEIENIYKKKEKLLIPELIQIYELQLRLCKFSILKEINRALQFYHQPIIKSKFDEKKSFVKKYQEKSKQFEESLKASKSNHDTLETEIKELSEKIRVISKEIDDETVSSELFIREIFLMYSDTNFCKNNSQSLNYNEFIDAVAESMINGNDTEIIDGDYNTFNQNIFKDLFGTLDKKIKNLFSDYDDQILVVSVIGPQSTGKSTLLNKLFNTNFQMSAGRCSKGLYASIKKTTLNNKDHFLLILDTEGLLSIEKSNEEYDKQLTLFSMACSHIFIINVNGEINNAIRKILSISLYAAAKTQTLRHKPIVYFVLRNMNDTNIEKQSEMIVGIENALNEVSKLSNVAFKSVLDYRNQDSFILTISAFKKDSVYHESNPIFEKTTSALDFCDTMEKFRAKLLENTVDHASPISKLSTWSNHAASIRSILQYFNDFFIYESVKEIEERDDLTKILNELIGSKLAPKMEKIKTKYLDLVENEVNDVKTVAFNISKHLESLNQVITDFKSEIIKEFLDNEKTKSKSKALIKEYTKRIVSIITPDDEEIRYKIGKLGETFSVKVILKNSINEMESYAKSIINDWQKQKNTTNENVDTLKTKFKDELEQKINTIKNEFDNKLKKLKKNDDQLSNLVYDLFMQLRTRLQTNDIYYVKQSIEKFKNNIDENNIFLRLNKNYGITNEPSSVKIDFQDIQCYFQFIEHQIPETLTQKEQKKKDL